MKKLLGLLAAFGLTATSGAAVVSCGNGEKDPAPKDEKGIDKIFGNDFKIVEGTTAKDAKASIVAVLTDVEATSYTITVNDAPATFAVADDAALVIGQTITLKVVKEFTVGDNTAKKDESKDFTVVKKDAVTPTEPTEIAALKTALKKIVDGQTFANAAELKTKVEAVKADNVAPLFDEETVPTDAKNVLIKYVATAKTTFDGVENTIAFTLTKAVEATSGTFADKTFAWSAEKADIFTISFDATLTA